MQGVQKRLSLIENTLASLSDCKEKVEKCEATVNAVQKQVAQLCSKMDDLENRSRRNNIVIYGIPENDDEGPESLRKYVENEIFSHLLKEVKTVERVHRAGKKITDRDRPVILRFYDFAEKMAILRSCSKLKGTNISISEDFSLAVRETRRKLWKSSKSNRDSGDRVVLLFDKLKINDTLYVWDRHVGKRIPLQPARSQTAGHEGSSSST